MPRSSALHPYSHLALVAAIAMAIPVAYAAPQDNRPSTPEEKPPAQISVYTFSSAGRAVLTVSKTVTSLPSSANRPRGALRA